MPAACPHDGTELVELERAGVRIDACRTCRGIWLDRGELEKILEREAQAFDRRDEEDEEFLREVTGGGHERGREHRGDQPGDQSGFDKRTAERIFEEFRGHKQHRGHGKRRKKSFLDELFD